jgi:flagellar motor switch protein FliM
MPESPSIEEVSPQVRPFDFQRHEGLDRSRLRRLSPVLEVAAHRVSQVLSGTVRMPVKAEIGELNQQPWEGFANSLPEPTFLATATVVPLGGRVALHVPLAFAMGVVELRLGGELSGYAPSRPLSDIEQMLFGEVAQSILGEVFQALSVVVPMAAGVMTSTSSAVLVQSSNPTEICLLVAINVAIGEVDPFELVVCFPLSVLLSLLDTLERRDMAEMNEPDSVASEVRDRLLEAPLDVSVSFPNIVLSPEELLSLAVGDVIPLHRPEGLPLRLIAGGIEFCEVVPTSNGKRLACMVIDSYKSEDR